jgi:hypothetical protein
MPRNFALSILRLGVHPLLSLLNTGHRIRFSSLLGETKIRLWPAGCQCRPISQIWLKKL